MSSNRKARETEEAKIAIFDALSYDAASGEFKWMRGGKNIRIGNIAGSLHSDGYRYIKVDQVRYSCQRLAWLFHTGDWPKENMDHINMDRSDNRIANLREATNSQNGFNSPMKRYNTSGFKGVSWSAREKKYRAQITANGKRNFLGSFDDPAAAAEAYKQAAQKLHGEFARTEAA
jgi:hypothetical protein